MARHGSPATPEVDWPAYDTARRATCVLDRTIRVEDDPHAALRALWDELRPAEVS